MLSWIWSCLLASVILYQIIMGKQTSKIKDYLYFGTADIFNKDTPQPIPQQEKTRYVPDYSSFKPQKFYKTGIPSKQAQLQVAKNNKKQQILKQFKYHQDFDRVDYQECEWYCTLQSSIEVLAKRVPFYLFAYMGVYVRQTYNDYFAWVLVRKAFVAGLAVNMIYAVYNISVDNVYHVVNHDMFRLTTPQMQLYQHFDIEAGLYKDVDQVKYKTKFPSWGGYHLTKHKTLVKEQEQRHRQMYQYFHHKEGVTPDLIQELIQDRAARRAKGDYGNQQEFQRIKKEIAK